MILWLGSQKGKICGGRTRQGSWREEAQQWGGSPKREGSLGFSRSPCPSKETTIPLPFIQWILNAWCDGSASGGGLEHWAKHWAMLRSGQSSFSGWELQESPCHLHSISGPCSPGESLNAQGACSPHHKGCIGSMQLPPSTRHVGSTDGMHPHALPCHVAMGEMAAEQYKCERQSSVGQHWLSSWPGGGIWLGNERSSFKPLEEERREGPWTWISCFLGMHLSH